MKNIFILFVLILMVTVCAQSQYLVKDRAFLAGFHIANSISDTSAQFPIISGIATVPTWVVPGQLADSIFIVHRASTDSVKADIYYQLTYDGTNYETAVAIDSIVAGAAGSSCIVKTTFQSAVGVRIYVAGRSSRNAVLASHCYTLVFIRELFKASPQPNK